MNQDNLTAINGAWQEAWVPPDNRDIHLWAHDHIDMGEFTPIPGKFSTDRSRYMIAPLQSLKDTTIRQVNVMASPQSGKSLLFAIYLLHCIANDAGPALWLNSSDDMVQEYAHQALIPLMKACPPVANLLSKNDRYVVTKKGIKFPHFNVMLSGAKERALQSLSQKRILGDEVYLWDNGFITQAKTRTVAYPHTHKICFFSQAGQWKDQWHDEFERGMVFEWGWLCPSCNKEQVLEWNKQREDGTYSGINWPNEKNKDGTWNIAKASKSPWLECYHCKHQLTDTAQNRRYLNDTGRYICTKADGDITVHSYRWNALANIDVPFSKLVAEFLYATEEKRQSNNLSPIFDFWMQRLARPYPTQFVAALCDIILADYNPSDKWGDYTFMTVDCQKDDFFYYVIRSWNKAGESRLIKYGSVHGWSELRRIQLDNKIDNRCFFIDSGYKADVVYAKAVEYSKTVQVTSRRTESLIWKTLKGDGKWRYKHKDGVEREYDELAYRDAGNGKVCPGFLWSNPSIKNRLSHLRDGKGTAWLANNVDEDYKTQLNSEVFTLMPGKNGQRPYWKWEAKPNVPNHYWDCECMQVVAALMTKCLGSKIEGHSIAQEEPIESGQTQ
jgi:hypothetical protein